MDARNKSGHDEVGNRSRGCGRHGEAHHEGVRRDVPDARRRRAAREIRALRLRENASQAVFARHLNVTAGLVSQWERSEKRPRGASLKLITLVAKNGLGAVA